nr:hypothetical protein [Tanacetum cinerariifolium]
MGRLFQVTLEGKSTAVNTAKPILLFVMILFL